ncbi:hypothetical protein H1R20_g835, partial [Candolleomyces eurysporus]
MATLNHFQVPLWYHPRYRCLPFVPLRPFFDDLMCAPLRRRLQEEEDFVKEDGMWTVPKDIVEEWMAIEKQTKWLIVWLEDYKKPNQRSLRPPSEMGLYRKFRSVRQATFFVQRTKYWFMILFSYATWLLSENHIFSNANRESSALWLYLVEHVDVNFLRCFVNSVVVCISSQVPRVGCFFDILSYHKDLTKTAHQMHRFISDLPPDLLAAFEQERLSPSLPEPRLYRDTAAVDAWRRTVANSFASSGGPVTWQAFFEAREVEHQRRLETETAKERQRRRDREMFAETGWSGTATYYKWEVNRVDGVRRRTLIEKDDVRVEMVRHAPNQRRFDAFRNEWDLCTEFGSWGDYDPQNRFYEEGDSDASSDDAGYEESPPRVDPGPYELPENTGPTTLPGLAEQDSPSSPPPTPERELGFEHTRHLSGRMAARLPLLFGVHLHGIPSTLPSVGTEHQNFIYRAFGGETQPRPLPDVTVNSLLYNIFISLLRYESDSTPLPGLSGNFDLDPVCRQLQGIIKSTVTKTDAVFLIKPWSNGPCPTIVVYRPEAAIFCCRLENRDFEMVPPVVSEGSKVDRAVYDRFVNSRRLFLVGHRRRAALLQGGLISRIAREVIGSDEECERLILQDPSPTVLSCLDNIVEDLGNGSFLYDDVLSEFEKDYILGVHFHLKGDPSLYQYTAKSWWPRASVLEKDATSLYHWYWDDHNEHWYARTAAELSDREGKFPAPKRTSKWKKDSHLALSVKQFYRGYKSLCESVLDTALV